MESTSARTGTCPSVPAAHPRPEGRDRCTITGLTAHTRELTQLEPIAGRVAGDRYPAMSGTATARE